jgi:hypothetical protein
MNKKSLLKTFSVFWRFLSKGRSSEAGKVIFGISFLRWTRICMIKSKTKFTWSLRYVHLTIPGLHASCKIYSLPWEKKGHSLLYLDHIRQDLMLKQQRFPLGSYRSYRIKKDHVIIYERLIRRTPQLSSPSFSSHLSSHFAKLYISLLNWKIILFY